MGSEYQGLLGERMGGMKDQRFTEEVTETLIEEKEFARHMR